MIKYLVIDLDGTLYPKYKEMEVCRKWASRMYSYTKMFGISDKEVKRIAGEYIRHGRISISAMLISKRFGMGSDKFVNYIYDTYAKDLRIKRDRRLLSLLAKLDKRFKIVVFTNSPLIWTKRILKEIGIEKIITKNKLITFETLDHGRALKPGRSAFKILVKRLGSRDNILVIDDSSKNVETAKAMGMNTIQVFNKGRRKKGEADIHSALESLLK